MGIKINIGNKFGNAIYLHSIILYVRNLGWLEMLILKMVKLLVGTYWELN